MRKVLHLRSSGQLLGAERVVLELAKFLPDYGYIPIVGVPVERGTRAPELVEAVRQLGVEVLEIPIDHAFDLSAAKLIREFASDNAVDILHSHGYREDLYAILAAGKSQLIATNHLWKKTNWRLKLYASLDARLLRRFGKIIAVSGSVKNDMINVGIPAEKITVIPNGIDTQLFDLVDAGGIRSTIRNEFGIADDIKLMATLSSLSPEKGIKFIIEALPRIQSTLPNTHLLIIGEGEEYASLHAIVKEYGMESEVTFTGRRSDIQHLLQAIDLFVLPSLVEGLPMALLEAMAVGRPVVATRVGDVPAVFNAELNSEFGDLVDPGNVDQLVAACIEILACDEMLTARGHAARLCVQAHFSAPSMARYNARLYDALVERTNSPQ